MHAWHAGADTTVDANRIVKRSLRIAENLAYIDHVGRGAVVAVVKQRNDKNGTVTRRS